MPGQFSPMQFLATGLPTYDIASFYVSFPYTCILTVPYSYGTVPFAYMGQSYMSMGHAIAYIRVWDNPIHVATDTCM